MPIYTPRETRCRLGWRDGWSTCKYLGTLYKSQIGPTKVLHPQGVCSASAQPTASTRNEAFKAEQFSGTWSAEVGEAQPYLIVPPTLSKRPTTPQVNGQHQIVFCSTFIACKQDPPKGAMRVCATNTNRSSLINKARAKAPGPF